MSFSSFLKAVLLFSFLFPVSSSYSQSSDKKTDSLAVKKGKSPIKAMVFSAVVPGLGQAYNKKYWKMPIIYASMGTTLYFFNTNHASFAHYKEAYISKTDTATSTVDYYPDLSAQQLLEYENYYRRYRDLNAIFTALIYAVNIVDAYVDAHLTTFDVSDNLTLRISPAIDLSARRKNPAMGLSVSVQF